MPPSLDHEAFTELFRNRPSLAADLLTGRFGVDLPTWRHARLDSGDLTELVPTEYRADGVVVYTDDVDPVLAVVVEIQRSRDPRKRRSWPVYLATIHARLACPAVLLVVCVDAGVAAWCTKPIAIGHPGWVLTPLVLGPDRIPPVTDLSQARRCPELAVLSAMTHCATHPERDQIYHALLVGLEGVDDDQATLYHDVLMAVLPEAARRHLEDLMSTGLREYQSEFARKYVGQGLTEGEAKGEAKALLTVLATRGIDVPDEVRERITGCMDLDQLETWISRAVTATSIDEVFA